MRFLFILLFLFLGCDDNNPIINQEDDFTSILLTDSIGYSYGYEGNEDNYGYCTSEYLTVSYPYPNPSQTGFTINFSSSIPANITITVINDSYEYIETVHDSSIQPYISYQQIWDALDFNNNQVPDGYYRILLTSSNGEECYFNFKKFLPYD